MLLRMSSLFVRTLREDPADAEVPSHRLLVRAGYVRRAAPGVYSWLPLGKLVLDNIARVVREELAAIGAQEVSFPALLPREVYDASGRTAEYGDDIFQLRDRRGGQYVLGPTHEEMFTLLVKDLYTSYKDYPVILYQLQTKYRDEQRPRAGLLRGREFVMKDSYSFDLSAEGLAASYDKHRQAYIRIFDRLGLRYSIVAARSGAMGGSRSEEFLAVAPNGEDTFVACSACGYAANTEAMVTPPGTADGASHPAARVLDTPDTPTIDSLVAHLNAAGLDRAFTAADTLKNVVVNVHAPGADAAETLVIGVPGDREVDLKRLAAAVFPATVTLFTEADFAAHQDLIKGYIGPQLLAKLGIRYLVDPRIVAGTAWATGANEPGRHAVDVVCGRDFSPDGTIEAAEVRAGDPCPHCGAALSIERGIEIGHIFALENRFSDVFLLDALGPDGKPVRVTMGSYGVGVSRAVAAIAEQTCDDHGLCWPASIAPAQVHIVAAGRGSQEAVALTLAGELADHGLRVLVDDRSEVSAGVKFADSELLGAPTIVVVGRRLVDGMVEVRDRASGSRVDVPVQDVVARLVRAG